MSSTELSQRKLLEHQVVIELCARYCPSHCARSEEDRSVCEHMARQTARQC